MKKQVQFFVSQDNWPRS